MRLLEELGSCLFCPEVLLRDPDQKVVWKSDYWAVTPNRYPYAGSRLHLLLVPWMHATELMELSDECRNAFWDALSWVKSNYSLDYYGLASRNGDCTYTGGTISHFHFHLVVGDPDKSEPVRIRLSS